MYKVRYNIIKLKKFKLMQTGVCLLKVLLNLYRMYTLYRYSSGTITLSSESLVQTLSNKREKYNKYQSLLLKTDTHESSVPDRYQDAHEYYVQLVNNLTELLDAR